jgi:hypothetical protein
MRPNTTLLNMLGGETMDRIDMEDALSIINDYIDLLLCIHMEYEPSIDKKDMTKYKVGVQTFALKIKEVLNSLNMEEE